MRRILVLLLFCLASTRCIFRDKDYSQDFIDAHSHFGYPIEIHRTVTEDGFHLTMFRMQKGGFLESRPVVFMQHGYSRNADSWFKNKDHSLCLKLIEAGFDVWIGNNRGNKYSVHSDRWEVTSVNYWEFSFQEMAQYDIPAMIRYVLEATRQGNITYVGYSQGNSQMFAALSDPETSDWLNQKISHFIALAPVVYMNKVSNLPIKIAAKMGRSVNKVVKSFKKWFGKKKKAPPSQQKLTLELSSEEEGLKPQNDFLRQQGLSDNHFDVSRIPVIGRLLKRNIPDHYSHQGLDHFGQLINKKNPTFRRYDYGAHKNLIHYNSKTAPDYDLSLVTTKVTSYVGLKDRVSTWKDVENLKKVIPHMKVNVFNNWRHSSFIGKVKTSDEFDEMVASLKSDLDN